MIALVVMAWMVVAIAVVGAWRARVVDVRHFDRNGTAATTVTVRRGRRIYATTRFHRYDRDTGQYFPFEVVDQRVTELGQWRSDQ